MSENWLRVVVPVKTTNPMNGSFGATRGAMFAKAAQRKKQREAARLVVGVALKACDVGVPCDIKLTRLAPSNGLDDDALPASCKSIRDGITDALGLTNDRDPRLSWSYDQERSPKGVYGVRVEIVRRAK